jgi:peptidoglycan/LPS O-acetylase OafA/YrhL
LDFYILEYILTKHYLTLDGMRGVAALAVVSLHAKGLMGVTLLPSSYLAVDFFFALSGFVLAHAYDERLERGMTTAQFLRLRLVRLYPLFGLACAVAFVFLCLRIAAGKTSALNAALQISNLALIPSSPEAGGALYPLNYVAWSLALEIVVNIFFAVGIHRLRSANFLIAIICAGALALCAAALKFGDLDVGVIWKDAWGGLARVTFSFFLGVAIYRAHRARPFLIHASWNMPLLAALLAIFAVTPATTGHRVAYDLAAVIFAFPVLVFLGASTQGITRLDAFMRFMGVTSYAIYVLHLPLRELYWSAAKICNAQPSIGLGVGFMISAILASYLADRIYDRPARNFLGSLMLKKRA